MTWQGTKENLGTQISCLIWPSALRSSVAHSLGHSTFCWIRNHPCFCLQHRWKHRETEPSLSCPEECPERILGPVSLWCSWGWGTHTRQEAQHTYSAVPAPPLSRGISSVVGRWVCPERPSSCWGCPTGEMSHYLHPQLPAESSCGSVMRNQCQEGSRQGSPELVFQMQTLRKMPVSHIQCS